VLDPRIYRAAFLPVIFALVLVGFSLREQPNGATTALTPDAFDGDAAFTQLDQLATAAPNRLPGSRGDRLVAQRVSDGFSANGFRVSERSFQAETVDGERQVQTVIGERTGFSSGKLVVVAARDAVGTGARAQLSGTAALLQLAQVLGGRTLDRTLELASISGGPAAAQELASHLGGSADAVIVLGDLAGTATRQPVVVPYGDNASSASMQLRRTVEMAVSTEVGLTSAGTGLANQFVRLAAPLTLGAQGPFNGDGVSAVLLSASGERPPAADAPVSAQRLTAFGRAALRALSALDARSPVPAPQPYLLLEQKLLPEWPIRLLGVVLLLPVLLSTIDGFARVRRRKEPVGRWLRWVGACVLPFLIGVVLIKLLKATGVLDAAPPGPVAADWVPRDGAALAAIVSVVVVTAVGWFALRPLAARAIGVPRGTPTQGAAAAALIVLCACALIVWVLNPYTALLLVPALHLWLLAVGTTERLHPLAALAMFAVGLVPPLLIGLSYMLQFGLDPLQLLWMGLLLVAGGGVSLPTALGWAVVLGCGGAVLLIVVRGAFAGGPDERGTGKAASVRGPRSYAGPGSLGGTESALRR
jgi:hypothetical protein